MSEYCKNCYELTEKLEAKEQECEKLKKELIKKDEINTFLNTPIEGWSNDPCEICKYKQILVEIKEIAQGVRSYLSYPTPRDVRYEMDRILQKISEVENDKSVL